MFKVAYSAIYNTAIMQASLPPTVCTGKSIRELIKSNSELVTLTGIMV